MAKIIKYVFCISCVFLFSSARAQDTVINTIPEMPPVETYDNEVTTTYYERNEFSVYDSIPMIEERKINSQTLNSVRNDDDYWYANMAPKEEEKKKTQPKFQVKTNWFDSFFWFLLIGGFIALLIWFLSTSNISLLRRSPEVIEIPGEEAADNIFELNFDRDIQNAVNSKNYSLAIRLMYLQVLRLMADRHLIQYAAEKTNSDYLFQLSSTKYYKDFFRLTRHFDYVWYGKFPVTDESFEILRKDFFTFKQALG
jgi:hypothetical protein